MHRDVGCRMPVAILRNYVRRIDRANKKGTQRPRETPKTFRNES